MRMMFICKGNYVHVGRFRPIYVQQCRTLLLTEELAFGNRVDIMNITYGKV